MDCSWAVWYFLSQNSQLPEELLWTIRNGSNQEFLSALSTTALKQDLTDLIASHFEPLLLDICSRWNAHDITAVARALARILPAFPRLSDVAQQIFSSYEDVDLLSDLKTDGTENHNDWNREILLSVFRLLNFDNEAFARFIRPARLQWFLRHEDASIRNLAIRIVSQYIYASDATLEDMMLKYLGSESAIGTWDQKTIDFRFLSLWENKRISDFEDRVKSIRILWSRSSRPERPPRIIQQEDLSEAVALVSGNLLRREKVFNAAINTDHSFVPTPTTKANLHLISEALIHSRPLLLTGLAGSGKTFLVKHISRRLNKSESMITLHLNEQSDAKLLIGIYTTGSRPGSFEWKPGVLTTAVTEGRWVLIEDLDRAPNEVLSTILPLIEFGELSIPSRGQKIIAAPGFKIIATMRSSTNLQGDVSAPTGRLLGLRLWRTVEIAAPKMEELGEMILSQFPVVRPLINEIMVVYQNLSDDASMSEVRARSQARDRPISPRELLKWADRINGVLSRRGSKNSLESISEEAVDGIFLDAVDCFVGHLEDDYLRRSWISVIAKELRVDPQRREYLTRTRSVALKRIVSSTGASITVGRAFLTASNIKKNLISNTTAASFAINGYSLRLIERVTAAIERKEPLLLVGETGIGKTATVQHLSNVTANKLVTINLSQQSETGDLLGGFKPVNLRSMAIPLKDEFDTFFDRTFSQSRNQEFSEQLAKCIAKGRWKRAVVLWKTAIVKIESVAQQREGIGSSSAQSNGDQSVKRRKIRSSPPQDVLGRLEKFSRKLEAFEKQINGPINTFQFAFVEGKLITAVREGHWVLLDEINLAGSDTLECLSELLESGLHAQPSIVLAETGDVERIVAHPNFRIFAAMNPANDVGKKDLPLSIRSRFTEIFVNSPDNDFQSLRDIAKMYTEVLSPGSAGLALAAKVASLYQKIQATTAEEGLVDGSGQAAHFSLRTLTRALAHANVVAPQCTVRRAIYEGFCLCFFTCLHAQCEARLQQLVTSSLFNDNKTARAELRSQLRPPRPEGDFVPVSLRVQGMENPKQLREEIHWLSKGPLAVEDSADYVITPYVRHNLENLIRAAFTRKYPVLIQGPTSAGKTSMIEYLAKRSGNKYVRVNNHEHTDLQEYLGSYVSATDGSLVFQEGVLVQAVRQGHWVVLDELNLAPTEVLEALNRLLDDNHEILIPETQEVVKAHPNFMLFATQNPAGPYGGRKVLSRAFRNRFVELHFDDIPVEELNIILAYRSSLPASWCGLIVEVYKRLSTLRQEQRLFETNSFATLRDLFRWANRAAESVEELATQGYMLLAEKVRKDDERESVKHIIEQVMSRKGVKVRIEDRTLYTAHNCAEMRQYDQLQSPNILWTQSMRRLFVLVAHAIRHNEPVLLVGETGCGKTTVCEMIAKGLEKRLHVVNAHQNTETGDLIGAQRPIRNRSTIEEELNYDLRECLSNIPSIIGDSSQGIDSMIEVFDKLEREGRLAELDPNVYARITANRANRKALFEWSDGSLVQAMRSGAFYLLDEISLAEDSVLERMNSVLDPQRTILLAEKGSDDPLVVAQDGFQFLATMNPGGDFGKKELSPALRNRFTEIWVPPFSDFDDVLQIVDAKLSGEAKRYATTMVEFAKWFSEKYSSFKLSTISIRDLLAWTEFVNSQSLPPVLSIVHGAALVYVDTLGANPSAFLEISGENIEKERDACIQKLCQLLKQDIRFEFSNIPELRKVNNKLQFGHFAINTADTKLSQNSFQFETPTTKLNAMRIIRALQLSKPTLLEGSPGVGKTSIVTAIASAAGRNLTRINLSDQTDLIDLFGSDVPVENSDAGVFQWRDAPFLTALKRGDWVLLDEMNLASQSILEGLNACLDHRGEAYIAELDQTFVKHPEFRLFAAQNPHHQGGGRKGLPSSFVNRFTVVYIDSFKPEDLSVICDRVFPSLGAQIPTGKLIEFVTRLSDETTYQRRFGSKGSPWEFNLRDILRWLQLLASNEGILPAGTPDAYFDMLFAQRFRTHFDVQKARSLFTSIYQQTISERQLFTNIEPRTAQIGLALLTRRGDVYSKSSPLDFSFTPRLPLLESMMLCVQQNWPLILTGSSGSGKTSLIKALASISGAELDVFPLNADIDATDLIGGFEQVDASRRIREFLNVLSRFCLFQSRQVLLGKADPHQTTKLSKLFDLQTQLKTLLHDNFNLAALYELFYEYSLMNPSKEVSLIEHQFRSLVTISQNSDAGKFEWVDGILVKALDSGRWLVLDNANLCSSSVLDRMNSLLEPDGSLVLNEHYNEDGTARVIKPHPNFRIFLTLDPQYGELSRAMRNRAVELYVPHINEELSSGGIDKPASLVPIEPSLAAFQENLKLIESLPVDNPTESSLRLRLAAERQPHKDLDAWSTFAKQAQQGLVSEDKRELFEALSQASLRLAQSKTDSKFALGYYENIQQHLGLVDAFSMSQPIHVMNNQPLIAYGRELDFQLDALKLGKLQDILLDTLDMEQTFLIAVNTRPATTEFTRLQQSFAARSNLHLLQSPSLKVSAFLKSVCAAIRTWAFDCRSEAANDESFFRFVLHICSIWWTIFNEVNSAVFDEGRFRTTLGLGIITATNANPTTPASFVFTKSITKHFDEFDEVIQLNTGLSMEPLWELFRPITVPKLTQLQSLFQLYRLAEKFDDIVWRIHAPFQDVLSLRSSIIRAINLALKQTVVVDSVSKALDDAINGVRTDSEGYYVHLQPFFQRTFEYLCLNYDLRVAGQSDDSQDSLQSGEQLELLACRSTKEAGIFSQSSSAAQDLARLSRYAKISGRDDDLAVTEINWHFDTLIKLQMSHNVNLRGLELLQHETKVLGLELSIHSKTLSVPYLTSVFSPLCRLVKSVLLEHEQFFNDHFIEQLQKKDLESILQELATERRLDDSIFSKQLEIEYRAKGLVTKTITSLCLVALQYRKSSHQYVSGLSDCFIAFSLLCLHLYVPDKPWDPALRSKVERDMFLQRQQFLKDKFSSLAFLERYFTGRSVSLRGKLCEETLKELGSIPATVQIARPIKSKINEVQIEFNNVLKALKPIFNSWTEGQIHQLKDTELWSNIIAMIQRLNNSVEEYSDLTTPAMRFLQLLKIGLDLSRVAHDQRQDCGHLLYKLIRMPFVTSLPAFWQPNLFTPPKDISQSSASESLAERLLVLRSYALRSGVQNPESWPREIVQGLTSLLADLYAEWKRQLTFDQKAEQTKASLYRYRGNEDVEAAEEQQFDDLFPVFETDSHNTSSNKASSQKISPQKIASKITDVVAAIFSNKPKKVDNDFKLMIEQAASITTDSEELQGPSAITVDIKNILPVILLQVRRLRHDFTSASKTSALYNVYVDPNLQEAQGLVSLVYEIRDKIRPISEVWPEHATLHRILTVCEELLSFRHTEPIMKFLTKVEQLYSYMAEWQSVASREYSIENPLLKVTDLLIHWRQLELSTWARLLDVETERCNQDAQAWWFVAYENICAIPASLHENEEIMYKHAGELLETLESFISASSLGQFHGKLQVLESLQALTSLSLDLTPSFHPINGALQNFIRYYSRYSKGISTKISQGRQNLEKEVKDVLKLASWNDRNVESLKQSARKSHLKLFRIVRKYRDLLAQPVDSVLNEEILDTNAIEIDQTRTVTELPDLTLGLDEIQAHKTQNGGWDNFPPRLKNASATITTMQSKASVETAFEDQKPEERLDTFIDSLQLSMEQLRKETPSTLTEENAPLVKHLLVRKRRLFAEMLKEIRQMGMSSNPSLDVLGQQNSLGTTLSRMSPLSTSDANQTAHTAESFLLSTLNLMPTVRQSRSNYHDDLGRDEVARSVGFIESLLSLSLRLRNFYVFSTKRVQSLEELISQVTHIWADGRSKLYLRDNSTISNQEWVKYGAMYLGPIVRLGADVLSAQAELGDLDLSEAIDVLLKWAATFEELNQALLCLPTLPSGLLSQYEITLSERYNNFVDDFLHYLTGTSHDERKPHVELVFDQLSSWINIHRSESGSVNTTSNGYTQVDLASFDSEVIQIVDLILGAIQDVENVLYIEKENTEQRDWLIRQIRRQESVIKAFHIPTITQAVGRILPLLCRFGGYRLDKLQNACASIILALPILRTYHRLVSHAMAKYTELHRATSRTTYRLAKSFTTVASQGFCKPTESSDEQGAASENLESGTGLGDGDGGEDISKDIGNDEDLSELAQDPENSNAEGGLEKEEDAVDVADALEGAAADENGDIEEDDEEKQSDPGSDSDAESGDGSVGGGEGGADDEAADAKDDEVGGVDDLGPSAVDEKLWDQAADEDKKTKEGKQSDKNIDKNDQAAANDDESAGKDPKEDGQAEGEDEQGEDDADIDMSENSDAASAGDDGVMDPQVHESEGFEFPEDLQLDGDKNHNDDSADSDEFMVDNTTEEADDTEWDDGKKSEDSEVMNEDDANEVERSQGEQMHEEDEVDSNEDAKDATKEQMTPEENYNAGDTMDLHNEAAGGIGNDAMQDQSDATNPDNMAQGTGPEIEDEQHDFSESSAQRQTGAESQASKESRMSAGDSISKGGQSKPQVSRDRETIRKLGNIFEEWHRRQQEIHDASEEARTAQDEDVDMADAEFEHLPDDDAKEDTQALGASTEEQATALDESKAISSGEKDPSVATQVEPPNPFELSEEPNDEQEIEAQEARDTSETQQRPGAFVGERPQQEAPFSAPMDENLTEEEGAAQDIESVDDQLSVMHIDPSSPITTASATDHHALWQHHESRTHGLAQTLTAHLRLILEPTLATKMRGDFRTGKRLNIKRIIPYIASSFKRDKIWMRRSVPTKRAYQVMLAIDDSRSMVDGSRGGGDGGGGNSTAAPSDMAGGTSISSKDMAFDTLALLWRALDALDVGEMAVLGFGATVFVAHEFGAPLGAEAGARVLRQFAFEQPQTDVKQLLRRSIELFRAARLRRGGGGGGGGEALWQLQLVVSDGLCEDHEGIRRLLLEAREERVLVVFVIVDAGAAEGAPGGAKDGVSHGQSIVDLERVEFVADGGGQAGEGEGDGAGEMKLVRKKYLESFPFEYYLVVKDVRELPHVLAAALRQWFAEVAER